MDRVLPYVTGGAAFGDIRANPTGFAGQTETNVGWTVGAGIEAAVASNLTAKVEYLYVDLGSFNCSAANCGTRDRRFVPRRPPARRHELPLLSSGRMNAKPRPAGPGFFAHFDAKYSFRVPSPYVW